MLQILMLLFEENRNNENSVDGKLYEESFPFFLGLKRHEDEN